MIVPESPKPSDRTASNRPAAAPGREPDAEATPEQIEADIARTRQDLGETVEQLTSALDVKEQARHQLDAAKDRAAAQLTRARAGAEEGLRTARDSVTDDDGRLARNGWVAVCALGVCLGLGVVLLVRAARR